MPLVDKSQLPLVAMPSMNEVHLEEVDMLNAFSDLLDRVAGAGTPSDADLAEIDRQLDALVAHTQDHFAGEEELMIMAQFPAYPMHKGEHESRLAYTAQVVAAWKSERSVEDLRTFVQKDVPAWVVNHIQTMDTITALFLSQSA